MAALRRAPRARRHALGLSPLLLGALVWGLWAGAHPDPRAIAFTPLLDRLDDYEESVLGGYRDATEAHLMILFLIAWAVLAARCFPVSRKRWRALSHHERLLWTSSG